MTETPEQVLEDERGAAAILRLHGHAAQADSQIRMCDRFARAFEPYLRFISEGEACVRAGKSLKWIRGLYLDLAPDGHARIKDGHRQYRECFVPRRADSIGAHEAGRAAVRRAS